GSPGSDAEQFAAQVVRINPSASAGNRAVPVYLQVQAPPDSITLRPGMYVQGSIHTGEVTTVTVPLTSIRTDQPLPYVQRVDHGKVLHQPIAIGDQRTQDGHTWVAVQGMSEGTQILSGQVGAVPAGSTVQLAPAMSAAASATSSPE
ncbi:MAG: efflux transporter periplasmic adaptor subunit, partial [Comamonas sp.]|nr:efflux transporter periplasmic adaptor subunit [Candidatus Comamonas equi]